MNKVKKSQVPSLVENYLNKFIKNNKLQNLNEEEMNMPFSRFEVQNDSDVVMPAVPGDHGGLYQYHPKLPWNWSPPGGWPNGYKFREPNGTLWIYHKESNQWRVYDKNGDVIIYIPHGEPNRYWQPIRSIPGAGEVEPVNPYL